VKVEKRMVPEHGVTLDGVWVSYEFLEELSDQGVFDSQFGKVLLANRDQERVLEARGLAERETRGGVHRGSGLEEFMKGLEWPEEEAGK
jgi:hypothetical protein